MKMMTLVFLFLFAGHAWGQATVELQPGAVFSVQDKNLGDLIVKCLPGNSVQALGQSFAFCKNSNKLVIEVDGANESDSLQLALTNSFSCQNALDVLKPGMGEFAGTKTFLFCDGNKLHKLKLNAAGTITSTITALSSSYECQNAID